MKTTKLLTGVLIASLMVTGCQNAEQSSSKKPAESKVDNKSPYLASKKPMDMTIHYHHYDGLYVFDNDWDVFKKAAEETNVTLKGVAPKTSTNSVEAFNLMIASGEIPNLVFGIKNDINEYAQEGAFLSLDELIKKHAPNIQRMIEKMPEIKASNVAADGKLYVVPYVYSEGAAQGYFIRKDWMDKLGLKTPETVDDYYNVLKAFRENDPNGNGKKDEVPYFNRDGSYLDDLVTLWGANEGLYLDGDKVKFGPMEGEYAKAMENLAKWYKEGLIDPEIFTRGSEARDYMLGNNLGGSTRDWFASTSAYNEQLKDKVKGLQFVPIAPPENTEGKRVEPTSRNPITDMGLAIGHTTEDPVAAIKYLDFFFTEEGRKLMNYGVEGVTYDLVDGKPVLKDEILNSQSVPEKLRQYGAQTNLPYQHDAEYEKQFLNEIAIQGVELYEKNNYFRTLFPTLGFTKDEEKVITDKKAQIVTYVDETVQKWIMGVEPINFEAFKKQLEKLGIEEYLKTNQQAYDRMKRN
ncbi:extracellular solute-binding protein [Neobacillus drentensis]|uniref:extracellular solute-binding protein n=1 Tax=Neobacillus drentensis TaxID=220684 RepID=UPI002FFE1B54